MHLLKDYIKKQLCFQSDKVTKQIWKIGRLENLKIGSASSKTLFSPHNNKKR